MITQRVINVKRHEKLLDEIVRSAEIVHKLVSGPNYSSGTPLT
ncbi:MAG: hypothetical protein QOE74_4919 [Mycobacterium sp.]|jgi:hypothetical protein|nr:hypothetical protein [Mycobacterium sp.]